MSLTGAGGKFVWQVVIAVGLLALLQIESSGEFGASDGRWRKNPKARGLSSLVRAAIGVTKSHRVKMLDQLRESMDGDELAGVSPYVQLGADDLLRRVLSMEIVSFDRQTLRSPDYQEEFGYDIIHYEIRHPAGPPSKVMAYVENGEVVLTVLTAKGDRAEYARYRAGVLEDAGEVEAERGAALLAQHLDSGIPFLSLAR